MRVSGRPPNKITWSKRGRATSVGNWDAQGRSRRSRTVLMTAKTIDLTFTQYRRVVVRQQRSHIMKKAIGSILCILAILRIVSLTILPQKADTTSHRVQDWALVAVLLAIGVSLSATKKPQDSDKE